MYVDFSNDGRFTALLGDDGKPALSSELVALDGELACEIPGLLPDGIYRVRIKVDTDNINPDGSESIVADGGCIADFLVNIVRKGNASLRLFTVDGSIDGLAGSNNGLFHNYSSFDFNHILP